MSGYLPYAGFKWLKNVDNCDVNFISEKSPIGRILEVDLEYPDESHYLHNDYPLAPEERAILYNMLSNYCKKVVDKYGIKLAVLKNKFQIWVTKLQKSSVVFVTGNETA